MCGLSVKGFTRHASQGMWCARGAQGMHSSERASTSLHMHLKMRESAAGGRQQGPAIEGNVESRLEGAEQDTGRRSAGRTATFKGKEPTSPCCPLIYLFLGGNPSCFSTRLRCLVSVACPSSH